MIFLCGKSFTFFFIRGGTRFIGIIKRWQDIHIDAEQIKIVLRNDQIHIPVQFCEHQFFPCLHNEKRTKGTDL